MDVPYKRTWPHQLRKSICRDALSIDICTPALAEVLTRQAHLKMDLRHLVAAQKDEANLCS